MYLLDQHVCTTMDHMMLDGIWTEMQKMVGLSRRLMHTVNFRGDDMFLLPRNPSSSSNYASTSASYQAHSCSTRPPFVPSSSTRPLFAPTASALYVSRPSPFYAIGTCFFIIVCTTYFFMPDLYFYRETTDTYGTGVFILGSFTGSAIGVLIHLLRTTSVARHHQA
jgi:hypothetical protein